MLTLLDSYVLFGQGGDDTLTGGSGVDQMQGGVGNDTYVFNLGDGTDTLIDASGANTIEFGAGIAAGDIRATYAANGDMTLTYNNGNDAVTIADGVAGNSIQTYRFAPSSGSGQAGSVLTHAGLMNIALQPLNYIGTAGNDIATGSHFADTLSGGAGDDRLSGNDGNDKLYGGQGADSLMGGDGNDLLNGNESNDSLFGNAGNDTLVGDTGDDTLTGGAGSDALNGGAGSDTYRFNLGDGRDTLTESITSNGLDTLAFGPGITAADLRYVRQDNGDLTIEVVNPNPSQPAPDSVTLTGWLTTGPMIERIAFADGSTLESADLANLPIAAIVGTAGDDTLGGTHYNDTLQGGAGHDTYVLVLGGGADSVIEDAGENSTVLLDGNLALDNANAFQRGNDLAIVLDNGRDSLTIKDYYTTPQAWNVADANGNSMSADDLKQCGKSKGGIGLAMNNTEWRMAA